MKPMLTIIEALIRFQVANGPSHTSVGPGQAVRRRLYCVWLSSTLEKESYIVAEQSPPPQKPTRRWPPPKLVRTLITRFYNSLYGETAVHQKRPSLTTKEFKRMIREGTMLRNLPSGGCVALGECDERQLLGQLTESDGKEFSRHLSTMTTWGEEFGDLEEAWKARLEMLHWSEEWPDELHSAAGETLPDPPLSIKGKQQVSATERMPISLCPTAMSLTHHLNPVELRTDEKSRLLELFLIADNLAGAEVGICPTTLNVVN
jgi:hypothetical protein